MAGAESQSAAAQADPVLPLKVTVAAGGVQRRFEINDQEDLAAALGVAVPDEGFEDIVSACTNVGLKVLLVTDAAGAVHYKAPAPPPVVRQEARKSAAPSGRPPEPRAARPQRPAHTRTARSFSMPKVHVGRLGINLLGAFFCLLVVAGFLRITAGSGSRMAPQAMTAQPATSRPQFASGWPGADDALPAPVASATLPDGFAPVLPDGAQTDPMDPVQSAFGVTPAFVPGTKR